MKRCLRWAAVVVAFLIGVVFWPGGERPFSAAKEWLLAGWVAAGFCVVVFTRLLRTRKLPQPALYATGIWVMSLALSAALGPDVSFDALIRALLPWAGFLLILYSRPERDKMMLALVLSGTCASVVALLQFAGLDPFLLLNLTGSLQGSSRIRVFSTLGNPNFVAAFLTAILPLTVSLCSGSIVSTRIRRLLVAAAIMQASGIIATGSRAPVLGFSAAAVWLLVRRRRSWMRILLPAAAICAALVALSPARPLGRTVAGRLYIWKIATSNLAGIPLMGYGTGAFALRFAGWQSRYLQANPTPVEFAGYQDHAHNDYLEILVDNGIPGLAAFLFMTARLWLASGSRGGPADGIRGGVLALLGVAAVDFPLHRPAELFVFWSLMALLWLPDDTAASETAEAPRVRGKPY